ncbi:MAG: hypothetical protein N2C14_10390 [Planctomycetales bacterium]
MKPDSSLSLLPLMLDDVPEGLRVVLEQEGVPAKNQAGQDSPGRFVLWDSDRKRLPELRPGQQPIDVADFRQGARDPFAMLLDESSALHCWNIDGLRLEEEVARVDRRAVRRWIVSQLRRRVEELGGIWLRVSPFPRPYRTAFNFRIDYDEYDPEHFANTMDAVDRLPEAFTHFVCGSSYQGQADALARLRNADVGSHGFRHHAYLDKQANLTNIRRGVEALRKEGLEPFGFAAPHGRFNRGLLSSLEELGIAYSSEFGLAYDDLPFCPRGSDALQVPAHPICLGLFLDAAAAARSRGESITDADAAERAERYFLRIAQRKLRAGEPIFLYGHPPRRLGAYPRVLHSRLDLVENDSSIWKTSLREFAGWWRERRRVSLRVDRQGDAFRVTADGLAGSTRFAAEVQWKNQAAFLPVEPVAEFSLDSLDFDPRGTSRLRRALRVDRPASLRDFVKRRIDWETVTPVEELKDGTWRGWAKRFFRHAVGKP